MNLYTNLFKLDDVEHLSFFVHNHKILIGIQFDGENFEEIKEFIKNFTDNDQRIPCDIEFSPHYHSYLDRGTTVTYSLFDNASCRHIDEGDYIFRSHDYHFFSKPFKEVDNSFNYIQISPIMVARMVEQNVHKPDNTVEVIGDDVTYIEYDGTEASATLIDDTLMIIGEQINSDVVYDGEQYQRYSQYRFFREKDYEEIHYDSHDIGFMVKYNFIDDKEPWWVYCDLSDIYITPVFCKEFGIYDNSVIVYDRKKNKVFGVNNTESADRYIKHFYPGTEVCTTF